MTFLRWVGRALEAVFRRWWLFGWILSGAALFGFFLLRLPASASTLTMQFLLLLIFMHDVIVFVGTLEQGRRPDV